MTDDVDDGIRMPDGSYADAPFPQHMTKQRRTDATFEKLFRAFYREGKKHHRDWPTTQDALWFGYQYGLKHKEPPVS